jgi:hypothetical protein
MQDPNVKKMIDELRRNWDTLNRIERGDLLRKLKALGCSTRGLQDELGQSATTVRRHMELAALPNQRRESVKAGVSAKKILAQEALVARQRGRQARVAEDLKTGCLSDQIADVAIQFCRAEGEPSRSPIRRSDLVSFLTNVESRLLTSEMSDRPPVVLVKRLDVAGLFKQFRPAENGDTAKLEHQAEWLANIVRATAPEPQIWRSTLAKVRLRADEIEPKKSLVELYHEGRKRQVEPFPPARVRRW